LQENMKDLPLFQGDNMPWLDDPDAAKMITGAFLQRDGGIGSDEDADSFFEPPSRSERRARRRAPMQGVADL
jgi:hypothetical protein